MGDSLRPQKAVSKEYEYNIAVPNDLPLGLGYSEVSLKTIGEESSLCSNFLSGVKE